MRVKLVAGNWKMNGNLAANEALVRALIAGMGDAACTVAVCVPEASRTGISEFLACSLQREFMSVR